MRDFAERGCLSRCKLKTWRCLPFVILFLLLSQGKNLCAAAEARPPFEFRDGDRVVFIGDTLIEREAAYGYVEERLVTQFPERHFIFRNLGWSADTPAGESRASFDFDKPGKGFEKIKEELTALQPTVMIVGYGMANSFAGPSGLSAFTNGLNHLLDTATTVCTNHSVRFILLSPIRHEDLGPPLPNPGEHNRDLALYVKDIENIAHDRRCEFISLFNLEGKGRRLTENGIHLSSWGYIHAAEAIAKGLGWPEKSRARITGAQAEALREAIRKKNDLYFDRWRPQNETYLFGFRKHEQGQNAKEIPMFDPLIAEQEKKIDELKQARGQEVETPQTRAKKDFRSVIRLERKTSPEARQQARSGADTNRPVFDVAEGLEVNL